MKPYDRLTTGARMSAMLLASLSMACSIREPEAAATSDTAQSTEMAPASQDDASHDTVTQASRAALELHSAAQLSHVADSLARGSTTGHTLGTHRTYMYLQSRRGASGVPEVHDAWTDITMVQSGRGTLIVGTRVAGSRLKSPGEHRGGSITDGASRPIAAGDLIIIPAGMAHQYQIAQGDSLRYLTVKVEESSRRR